MAERHVNVSCIPHAGCIREQGSGCGVRAAGERGQGDAVGWGLGEAPGALSILSLGFRAESSEESWAEPFPVATARGRRVNQPPRCPPAVGRAVW